MTGTIFCVNKSQFVPVIFEPPCILSEYNFLQSNLREPSFANPLFRVNSDDRNPNAHVPGLELLLINQQSVNLLRFWPQLRIKFNIILKCVYIHKILFS